MKLAALKARRARTFLELAAEFLDKAPADEVYSLEELAEKIGTPVPSTGYRKKLVAEDGHGMKVCLDGHFKWLYGSKKAVAALRKIL